MKRRQFLTALAVLPLSLVAQAQKLPNPNTWTVVTTYSTVDLDSYMFFYEEPGMYRFVLKHKVTRDVLLEVVQPKVYIDSYPGGSIGYERHLIAQVRKYGLAA